MLVAMKTTWTDAKRNPKECIHRFQCQLSGLTHPNKHGVDRHELLREMPVGTQLVLVPEPDNPVDRDAILVYRADDLGNDLGYLHASAAKRFCRMIECGATFSAELCWVDRRRPDYPTYHLYLFQLTQMTQKHRPMRHNAPTYRPNRTSL